MNQHFSFEKLAGYWSVFKILLRESILLLLLWLLLILYNNIVSKSYTEQWWEDIPITFYSLVLRSARGAEGRMVCLWLRARLGSRKNNCFSKIQLVGQKYWDKTT